MRKRSSAILFFVFLSSGVFSQQFRAGVLGGVSATQISGDQLSGFNKAGVVAGGFVSLELSQKFDMAMQIYYIQKGSRKNSDPENEDYTEYRLRLSYFEIPLLVQWKFSNRFIFEAGPTFGALVGSREEDEFGIIEQPREFSGFELGGLFGLNVRIKNNLMFNARMGNSFLPVRKHVSGEGYRLNQGQYNSALIFTLQYKFGPKE